VRAATYNVRGFRDGVGRVAGVIRELRPDVLLLQESGSRRTLRRFADDVEMRVARDPRLPFRRRVKNAVLLGDPWRFASVALVRFPGARRWYPRGALVAKVTSGDRTFWALSVHFGLDGAERGRQAESLIRLVEPFNVPVVVGGDLNATPDMRSTARVAATLRDAWSVRGRGDGPTFPSFAPAARIDYVFVGGGGEILSVVVGADGASEASDHLPVLARLRFPEEGSEEPADEPS
jgi:endonuclease/exonuclease/phosphatase family metal-dependent hydrolase